MANPFNRIQARLQAAAEIIRSQVENFFKGRNPEKNVDQEEFTPAPTEQTVLEESVDSSEAQAAEFPPNEEFEPEEPDDFGEEIDNTGDIELDDPTLLDPGNLRRIFVSLADAQEYAADIPVPTRVFRRNTDLLFQIEVKYP